MHITVNSNRCPEVDSGAGKKTVGNVTAMMICKRIIDPFGKDEVPLKLIQEKKNRG